MDTEPVIEILGPTAAIFGAGAALLAVGLAAVSALVARRRREELIGKELSLESRLDNLGDLMRKSALMLKELQAELEIRAELAEKAKADAERAEQLAQLNEPQRAALAALVEATLAGELSKSGRRSFWLNAAVNLLFFVAGGGLSVGATLFLAR